MTLLIEGSAPKTIASGLFLLVLSALGWTVLQHSIAGFSGNQIRGDPGPFFLSNLCLAIIAIAGCCLLLIGLWGAIIMRGDRTPGNDAARLRPWLLPLTFVLSLLLMPFGMETLGTTASVALFSGIWVYILLGTLSGHSWLHAAEALAFGVGTAAFVHVLFVRLLTLPLPN